MDTGIPICADPVAQRQRHQPHFSGGVKAMFGYQSGNTAYELVRFLYGQTSSNVRTTSKGMINAPYINPPVGFEGDNGLLLQGDMFQSDVARPGRQRGIQLPQMAFLLPVPSYTCGIRYLDIYERYSEYFGDDDLTVINALTGLPDPTKRSDVHDDGPQPHRRPAAGPRFHLPNRHVAGLSTPGEGGPRHQHRRKRRRARARRRPDRPPGRQRGTAFSTVLELGDEFSTSTSRRIAASAPATIAFGLDVVTAINQTSYDLSQIPSLNHNGTMFFSGPSASSSGPTNPLNA